MAAFSKENSTKNMAISIEIRSKPSLDKQAYPFVYERLLVIQRSASAAEAQVREILVLQMMNFVFKRRISDLK